MGGGGGRKVARGTGLCMGIICVRESGNARPGAVPAWEAQALSFAIGESTSDLAHLLPYSPSK
jgi:hypothetical protein